MSLNMHWNFDQITKEFDSTYTAKKFNDWPYIMVNDKSNATQEIFLARNQIYASFDEYWGEVA